MIRDDRNNMGVGFGIAPATLDADNTPAAVDLRGYESATVLVNVGVGGITFDATNKVEFKLTHSDDDSTYTAVTVDEVTGLESVGTGGIIRSLVAAHAAATSTRVGYIGGKRYLKVLADFSGTHGAGTPISVPVILTRAHQRPVA